MTWLDNDIRWEREQAVKARRNADELRDPSWLRHEKGRREAAVDLKRIELRTAEAELAELLDDETRESSAARYDRDADMWDRMADEHERYREQKDQGGLFEAEPA